MSGNIGAINANGIIRGNRIVVTDGDLIAIRAGFGGETVGFGFEAIEADGDGGGDAGGDERITPVKTK